MPNQTEHNLREFINHTSIIRALCGGVTVKTVREVPRSNFSSDANYKCICQYKAHHTFYSITKLLTTPLMQSERVIEGWYGVPGQLGLCSIITSKQQQIIYLLLSLHSSGIAATSSVKTLVEIMSQFNSSPVVNKQVSLPVLLLLFSITCQNVTSIYCQKTSLEMFKSNNDKSDFIIKSNKENIEI